MARGRFERASSASSDELFRGVVGRGTVPTAPVRPSAPAGEPAEPEADSKRFGRNFATTAFAQLVAQVLTLLVSVVLARKLGVAVYGVFVFGFAFPGWFLLLVSLGLDDVMSIQVAADRSRASRYLTLVSLLRLLLAAFAILALWVGTQLVLDDPTARTVTLILGVSSVVTTYATTFSSVFRAFERFEYAALITIAERSVTVSAALVVMFLGFGLVEVSLAFLAGSFVMLILSAVTARRKFAWFTRRVNAREAKHIVKSAIPFGLNNVVATFTYTTGIVLLTVMRDPESTGIFNAAFTLVLALFSFLSIVSIAALPMMSRINEQSWERLPSVLNQIQRLSLVIGVPMAFGGWLYAAPIITTFYGNAFLDSAQSFRVLILSFAVETAVMGIGPALAATGHMNVRLYIGAVGAAITMVLSALLIPPLGPVGVAYAFLASCIVVAVLSAAAIQRYVAPLRATGTLGKSIFAGTVMALVLVVVPGLSLWIGVLFGGLVYFAALFSVRGMSAEDRIVLWNALRGALFR